MKANKQNINHQNINHQKRLVVGVDFSMNSIGITVYYGNKNYKFVSIINRWVLSKAKTLDISKLSDIKRGALSVVDELLIFDRQPNSKKKNSGLKELSRWHTQNMVASNDLAQKVVNILLKLGCDNNTTFVFENYITKGGGDTTIQTIEFTKTTKDLIFNKISQNFIIVPAPTIKKFAGKGNYKKIDMMMSFIMVSHRSALRSFCYKNKSSLVINKKGDLVKPIDDIIDSWWLVKWYKHNEKSML